MPLSEIAGGGEGSVASFVVIRILFPAYKIVLDFNINLVKWKLNFVSCNFRLKSKL